MALPASCVVYDLGTVAYSGAAELQQALERARREGQVPDVLLLLEHPPVLTLGRSGGIGDILAPAEALAAEGITVFVTDRGGGVTYHGPGQLVAYPILDLPRRGLTVTGYVRLLEQTVIHLLAGFGIAAGHLPGYPGVWVDGEKVCALGVHISHGITRHGLALNVDPDLRHFSLIHPCGISDRGVTSLARLLGRPVAVAEVKGTFRESFRRTLGIPLVAGDADEIEAILKSLTPSVPLSLPKGEGEERVFGGHPQTPVRGGLTPSGLPKDEFRDELYGRLTAAP